MATKIEVWWSEHKFYVPPLLNAALSIICYGIGWDMSSHADAMPLARSGAAATAISIAFTLWRYGEILANGNAKAKAAIRQRIARMNLSHIDPARAAAEIDEKLDAQMRKINSRVSIALALLLIVATLVWGFGDLASVLL